MRLVADFCEDTLNARWPFVLAALLTLLLAEVA
jgi:hypothetical protein